MNDIEKVNTVRNLQNRVYEIIKNYVVQPEVPAGTRLYEEKLSKEIGVSRTPIRIALNRLDREGLIRITPNRGTFKTHLFWEEVVEIIKIRQSIECLALDMGKDLEKDLILKARLKNYVLLEAFLTSPDRAEKALRDSLQNIKPQKGR